MSLTFRPFGSGRAYTVNRDTELIAFRVDAPMPFAPDGSWVYAFVERGRRVGRWDWARDERGLEAIAEAYQTATDPGYQPPKWEAPGGESPTIRPPTRDLVARAMERARPGPPPSRGRLRIVPRTEEA